MKNFIHDLSQFTMWVSIFAVVFAFWYTLYLIAFGENIFWSFILLIVGILSTAISNYINEKTK